MVQGVNAHHQHRLDMDNCNSEYFVQLVVNRLDNGDATI